MPFKIFRTLLTTAVLVLAVWLGWGGAARIEGLLQQGATTGALVLPALRVVLAVVLAGAIYYALWAQSRIKEVLENIFSIPELIGKIGFTIGLLCIYRIGFHVSLPGVDVVKLSSWMETQAKGAFGQAIALFGMFTGGSLRQATLFGLGIMPYISASIIFQLLITVVPALEKLHKEGPVGQKKIQEYTRYLTVFLCLVQAMFWVNYMRANHLLYPEYQGSMLIYLTTVLGLTAGTIFLMWLGEQIDEYGIGNGISLLIMAGIVSRMPWAISQLSGMVTLNLTGPSSGKIGPVKILFLVGAFIFVVAGAILITQAQRRIPVQQAKHTRGRRVYGGQRHYMPLRVNQGGVMPIIFASAIMMFPGVLVGYLYRRWPGSDVLRMLNESLHIGSYTYTLLYIAMIFFFAYFWTTVQFRPKEMAEQLRDYGSFIPGLRPGKRTADYLERVMERITYCGAAFLAVIAVIPQTVNSMLGIPQRIEANLVMRNYGGILGGGTRIKGAYR